MGENLFGTPTTTDMLDLMKDYEDSFTSQTEAIDTFRTWCHNNERCDRKFGY